MKSSHLLFLALLVALAPAIAASRNESSYLKLGADIASGRATLLDKRNGVAWDLGAATEAALSKDGRSVVIRRTAASNDAIKLLDAYSAAAEDDVSTTTDPVASKQAAQARLRNAVPATQGGSSRQRKVAPSAQEAFEQGFRGH